jgi:tetratricopeptide (TPR) repeat protein
LRPELARSLNNLSLGLAGLGRQEEALAAVEEATQVYRELAGARPDEFRPDVAGSLNSLSASLAGLGRQEEALAAVEEAAQVYRELAAARPDAFRPDLALSLNNLRSCSGIWADRRTRWPRARKPSASAGSWPRPARTRSGPTWPAR